MSRPQFPVAWVGLLFVGILKFNLTFIPIGVSLCTLPIVAHLHVLSVVLALVFNATNAVGFTCASPLTPPPPAAGNDELITLVYDGTDADRDAKKRWATGIASQSFGFGGIGSSLVSGLGKAALGKVIG